MKELIKILYEGNYSCVIYNKTIRTFSQKGVMDLYSLLKKEPLFLEGASVADKVIGKAAAAIMIIGGVKSVYTDVISLNALMLLREAGIDHDFGRVVPFIQNRDQTDWCPLERICYEEKTAESILLLIEQFIGEMKSRKLNQPLIV
jgi:iron complex outermembrane receptor protein